MTLGLEVEYWVVDESGHLCDGRDLVDCHEHVKPEFVGPLLEVKTSPHENVTALGRELQDTLRTVLDAAEATGRQLVPLGTPLTEHDTPATTDRGELYEEIYGENVTSPKNCAGTHIHFEKTDVARQIDLLTALDPTVALVSSSPYYCGSRTAACARAQAYRKACGERFQQYCDLWPYPDDVDAWCERVQENFDEFVDIATDRGVDEQTVREHFCPEDTVLAPVRLRHELPTVEWRAPDAALPSQLLQLAEGVDRLMTQTQTKPVTRGEPGVLADQVRVPRFEELRSLSDEAIHRGLESTRVCEYLDAMGFDTERYDPLSAKLSGPDEIGRDETRRLRLNCAARLRADVESLDEQSRSHPSKPRVQYSAP
ncbi:Glutamate-cysteine ligase family 2(GCS2) [Halogranum amylolyticum]|uniref:Glutamate-cysteine ligase family 2(GCS2) n=1 Tax=Halogranum amylolyticum TaxID=660520 RepID=A0A1H8SFE7_9EURY|nr:glutamate-cysteine ligase family protein [Halogranum amylolyticum]SEO77739.1 Glutamate-cysteine ligase family 2(GCS2) [Halogranum amylolyticum]